ncbi:uncharacterized protein [Argopecten irradians]|uniref:uncharacterized protein n=1 Tax=Argopecten irradians TaxID=31199 RepID=UPI0037103102
MHIGTINTVVELTGPYGTTGICFAPIGGVPGGCTAGLTQDLTTGVTTFSIASVSRDTDQGVWSGIHGTEQGFINITVLTIPSLDVRQPTPGSTIMLSSTPNTETLTTAVTCAYPQVLLDLVFKLQGGGSTVSMLSSTYTCTSTGNTGCSDTDANSYTCTITPQYETDLVAGTTYNIQVTVNLDGQYQSIGLNDTITDTDFTVQS